MLWDKLSFLRGRNRPAAPAPTPAPVPSSKAPEKATKPPSTSRATGTSRVIPKESDADPEFGAGAIVPAPPPRAGAQAGQRRMSTPMRRQPAVESRPEAVEMPQPVVDGAQPAGEGQISAVEPVLPVPVSHAEVARFRSGAIERREPDEEEMANLLAYKGGVPTAPGGIVETSDQARTLTCYLGNGALLVSRTDPFNPNVMAVKQALKRAGLPVTTEFLVELDVIRRIYEAADRRFGNKRGGPRGGEMQQMQAEFIKLVREAAARSCSDIHVTVERYEAQIRVRADGVMEKVAQHPSGWASDLCAAAFNMADASDASYRPLEYQGARVSDIKTPLPEGVQAVRLQFNPLPNGGRYMICRLLYTSSAAAQGGDVDSLGYTRVHIEQIRRMRKKPFGINVISGPTGSGKSTTLQRALTALMREKRGQVNIITIEDPPEYVIQGAAQLPVLNAQTDEERNEKFRQAISASLRSDPDIVMIGEIRDKASSSLAFAAAMTGHQVWASLHANDAISILDRFRDQQVEDYKLADHTLVTGLIGQRLIRKLCPHCKVPFHRANADGLLDFDLARQVMEVVPEEKVSGVHIARPGGCEKCRNGYAGREVIAETIVPDLKFMKHARERDKVAAINYWLDELDGMTMLEHACQKMIRGLCDPRDVEDKAGEFIEFRRDRSEKVFGKLFDGAAA